MAERTLAGRYRLDRLIGAGGMGQVWHGWDLMLERYVAVKLLHGGGLAEDGVRLFLREARLAGALNHPGIVTVHDLGEEQDGTMYLVMELLDGTDLTARLRAETPPDADQAVGWALQLCDALACAHAAEVIHRDLKPANLFLTQAGTLKILDFGIARHRAALTATASMVIGTMAYMPPERLQGRLGDQRGDLYSVGCILFELLTGKPPFGSGDPAPLMLRHLTEPARSASPEASTAVPPELDRLILDLLAKSPDDRPSTAGEVAARLRSIGTGGAPGSPTLTAVPYAPTQLDPAAASPPPTPTAVDRPSTAPSHVQHSDPTMTAHWKQEETPKAGRPFVARPTPAPPPSPVPHDTRTAGAEAAAAAVVARLGSDFSFVEWVEELNRFAGASFPVEWLPTLWVTPGHAGRVGLTDAISRGWKAEELGAVLSAFDAAGYGEEADQMASRAAPRRRPGEFPRLTAGMRRAGQDRRLGLLLSSLAMLSPEFVKQARQELISAGDIKSASALVGGRFMHRLKGSPYNPHG
ncbi:serine/threonine-protein kinase [Streptomyces sp. NPDC004667]|uniref:serine/threonine-protein kinase n=1 Tax=Streptomyces sp. NPDC004667 TaxID=3154285 RepID=UPI0033A4CD36